MIDRHYLKNSTRRCNIGEYNVGKGAYIEAEWKGDILHVHLFMSPQHAYQVHHHISDSPKQVKGEVLRAIEYHFSYVTGLPMPKRDTASQRKSAAVRWWQPIREMYDLVDGDVIAAKDLVGNAVSRMREDKLTISAPKSILNVLLDIYATGKSKQRVQAW